MVCRWRGKGGGYGVEEKSVQSMGEMGEDFCLNVTQPFLRNLNRMSCNDGSRKLIAAFHSPLRKGRPSRMAMALTLEYLVGVPSMAASSGREKNASSDLHPKGP